VPDKTLFLTMPFPSDEMRKLAWTPDLPLTPTLLSALAVILRDRLKLSFLPPLRGVPSLGFGVAIDGVTAKGGWYPSDDDTIVFALAPLDDKRADELQEQALTAKARVSADVPLAAADVWSPQEASFGLFAQRDLALAQIKAETAAAKSAFGDDVTVVIVDQGINQSVLAKRFSTAKFSGGWIVDENGRGGPPRPPKLIQPGQWRDGHATRMAETVLSVAPRANILDLALLPSDIVDLPVYVSWAAGAYAMLKGLIPWLRQIPRYRGPWVLCNAWSVYDLSGDALSTSTLNYGDNPNNPLNQAVAALPQNDIADVVFAAGNCGQFFPHPSCGAGQIGPGRSIHGVAALPEVLTVGAVRSDQRWLGYSAQGPSPIAFGSTKPDLCAPSQFAGPADWGCAYTGTSTACALTAGALAAARSFPATRALSAAAMHARVRAKASAVVHEIVPNERHGAGLLDIDALL
jgi:hypothetical protein